MVGQVAFISFGMIYNLHRLNVHFRVVKNKIYIFFFEVVLGTRPKARQARSLAETTARSTRLFKAFVDVKSVLQPARSHFLFEPKLRQLY